MASYPKSGNTWLRAFLTNLIEKRQEPASINALLPKYFASNKILLEKVSGLEVSELTHEELDHLRSQVYRFLAEKSTVSTYMKIHDINYPKTNGSPLIPYDIISKVIYVVRNPLDIVSSLAFHQNCSADTAIDQMLTENYVLGASSHFQPKVPEVIGPWSQHVSHWTTAKGFDCITLRYEDMQAIPFGTFSSLAEFLQLNFEPPAIEKAIELSNFQILKNQEVHTVFSERNPQAQRFFRQGNTGSWKKELSSKQVDRIVSSCHEMMAVHGYLPG